MDARDQERRFLASRIEELERLDTNIKGSITNEKTQYNMMAARDSLIEDLSKRYEQMREDFKYNLDLIEHRDAEISRLNRLRKVDKKELEEKEADNKSLTSRLAALERKEYDLQQSIATERTHFKKLLSEIKDEMEDVKVATAEESRSRQQETDRLRGEVKKLTQARTEALEHQRGDLVSTYEHLMKEREQSYHSREKEIVTMISVLENKFEVIQTEALQLRSELRNTQTMHECADHELALKSDQLRALQYKYDDDCKARAQELDTANKRITELVSELDHCKLVASNDVSGGKAEISKLTMQLSHETQRYTDLERNYREYRQFSESEAEKLSVFAQHSQQQLEHALEEERRKVETNTEKLLATNTQLSEVDRELSQSRAEAARLRDDLESSKQLGERLQTQLNELKEVVRTQEKELEHEKHQCERRITELKESHNQTLLASIASAEASKNHDLALLRNSMELSNSRYGEEQDRHTQTLLAEHEQRCEALRQEIADWKRKEADVRQLLEAEKSECTVLRLRLQALQVSSNVPAREQRRQLAVALGTNTSINDESMYLPSVAPLTGTSSIDSPMFRSQQLGQGIFGDSRGAGANANANANAGVEEVTSMSLMSPDPLRYSDHFNNSGGTSFLDSPMLLPPHPPRAGTDVRDGADTTGAGVDIDGHEMKGTAASVNNNSNNNNNNNNLMSVVSENEELRRIIKQMRGEVEMMHQQQHHTSMSMLDSDMMGNYDILETRLRQTTAEVSRLHKERRRLIDISSSLQAQVNKQSKRLAIHQEIDQVQEAINATDRDREYGRMRQYADQQDLEETRHQQHVVGPIGQLAASLNSSRQQQQQHRSHPISSSSDITNNSSSSAGLHRNSIAIAGTSSAIHYTNKPVTTKLMESSTAAASSGSGVGQRQRRASIATTSATAGATATAGAPQRRASIANSNSSGISSSIRNRSHGTGAGTGASVSNKVPAIRNYALGDT